MHPKYTPKAAHPGALKRAIEFARVQRSVRNQSDVAVADTRCELSPPDSTRTRGFLRAATPFILIALVSIAVLVFMYRLWNGNLAYPLKDFGGDALLNVYAVKALAENAFFFNPRVGAPFGLYYYPFYQPDVLHQAIVKGLVWITRNPLLTVNIYLLLGFVLIAWSAFYVFRQFRLSSPIAFLCAELYAFTPSHLWRSYYHLVLSEYYLLPLVGLLALKIMAGAFKGGERSALLFALPVSVLVGLSGVYYAFYSMLFVGAATLYAAFRRERRRCALVGLVCFIAIGSTTLAGMIPAEIYTMRFGPNPNVAKRRVLDTEVFSLKLADLYLPAPNHPIKEFRQVTQAFTDSLPLINDNESKYSNLGILGAIGLSLMLLWPIWRPLYKDDGQIIAHLLILTLLAILFSITDGFGTLFSLLITPELRAHSRMIFFIAFFALFALGIVLDSLLRRLPDSKAARVLVLAMVGALLIFGLYDEGAAQSETNAAFFKAAYRSYDHFIRQIEAQSPTGGMVLQLPYEPFPESGGINHMGSYDPLRAYIHSRKLRWSFPAMSGGPYDEWIYELSSQPPGQMVKDAVLAGFCGIYVDRWGYPDLGASLESQLRSETKNEPIVSADGRFSFFSLQRVTARLKQEIPRSEWKRLKAEVLPDFLLGFPSGVYGLEASGSERWRWCAEKGTLEIINRMAQARDVDFTGKLISPAPTKASVLFHDGKQTFVADATARGSNFNWRIYLKPGPNYIEFQSDAPRVSAPGDTRELYFRMEDLAIH